MGRKPTSTPFDDRAYPRVYRRRRRGLRQDGAVYAEAPPTPDGFPDMFDVHSLRRPPEPEPDPAPPRRSPLRWAAVLGGFMLGVIAFWLSGFGGSALEALRAGVDARLAAAGFVFDTFDVRGAVRANPSDLQRALELPAGAVVFGLNPGAARQRIEALPWVREAAVLRLLPDRVVVIVREHRPLALWRATAEAPVLLVDDMGAVLDADLAAVETDLPELFGAGAPQAAPELAAALRERPRLRRLARRFERVGARRWDVHLHSGAVVKLPEGPSADVLAQLARLDAQTGFLEAPLGVIDMRNGVVLREPLHRARAGQVRERGA